MARNGLRLWLRRQRLLKQRFKRSRLFPLFGRHSLHPELWRADRAGLAGGLALGLFVAFTPTIPFQMLLAATGAILLKVNLPIALAACWITNPFTVLPVYLAALRLGETMIAAIPPLEDYLNLHYVDGGVAARHIRRMLQLGIGLLAYAVGASAVGYGMVCILWDLGARFTVAVRRIENPHAVKNTLKGLVPIVLLAVGLSLQRSGLIDAGWVRRYSLHYERMWWAPVALTLLMSLMYALALPGSILVIAFGFLHAPPFATLMATVGGTAGGLCGYYLTRYMTGAFARRYADSWLFNRLKQGSGFPVLFALRVLPGFPHAIINYSAGVLRTRIGSFAASTLLGFAVKGFIYTSAIHNAASLGDNPIGSFSVIWPLLAIALLAVAGGLAERLLSRRRREGPHSSAPMA